MELLKLIPKGRENAITRQQLCNLTGWGDRKVRGKSKSWSETATQYYLCQRVPVIGIAAISTK